MTVYSRSHPYPGRVLVNRSLTGAGSAKDTRHFEISLADSGFNYEPGDSMAVYASNDPTLVDEFISALHASGDEEVPVGKNETARLHDALTRNYSITAPPPKFLRAIVERASAAPLLKDLLVPERKQDLQQFLWGMEVIDFLLAHPSAKFAPAEFVGLLTKLQPRLYSIASSLRAHPDEVHFTVDVVRYASHGRERRGVASSFLAERCGTSSVPMYPSSSKHFHLPENPDAAIIMIGPGTGVAPFRAFLEERAATGATGKNWLFFGSQKAASDFFYRDEFEKMRGDGVLHKLDTAFSRDQAEKIYVQHRMRENGAEIWRWLEDGAYFYVCGDALRMAKDVDAMLREIVEKHGDKSPEEAAAFVEQLKADKRYKRDVY
ncbi:MAG: sulfite reductase subunit alpha [Verrucomicrobiota bacterium]|nr:sulfite reductase subunit alpha [Verrucomicrobiota bacterium]